MTKKHLCGFRRYSHRSRLKRFFCWFCLHLSSHYGTHDLDDRELVLPSMSLAMWRASRWAWKNSAQPDMESISISGLGPMPSESQDVL